MGTVTALRVSIVQRFYRIRKARNTVTVPLRPPAARGWSGMDSAWASEARPSVPPRPAGSRLRLCGLGPLSRTMPPNTIAPGRPSPMDSDSFHARSGRWLQSLVLVALSLFCPTAALSQMPSPMGCVSSLEFPIYKELARQAHIAGTASVRLQVEPDGRSSKLQVAGSHPLLERELRRVFEKARFLESCAGRDLSFEVTFSLEGEPRRQSGLVTRFDYPNRFILTAAPPVPSTQIN